MYETSHEIPYLYIRNSAPQDRGEQRPLRDGPIGPGRRRRDAHIVGYYAPAAGTRAEESLGHRDGAKRRAGAWVSWELLPYERNRCAEHGVTIGKSALERSVPAPPGVVMVAPPEISRNAQSGKVKAARVRGPQSAAKDSIRAGAQWGSPDPMSEADGPST